MKYQTPVVFVANGHGDHLLVLPAIRALAEMFKGHLRLVCAPWAADTFFQGLPFGEILVMEKIRRSIGPDGRTVIGHDFDASALADQLKTTNLLMVLHPWSSPSLLQLLEILAPARSIGFSPCYDLSLATTHDRHWSDLAFQVPQCLDPSLRLEDFSCRPAFSHESQCAADNLLREIPASMRVLVVHADTKPDKMWLSHRFNNVITRFLAYHPDFMVLVVGQENTLAQLCRFEDRVVPCFGYDLATSMALVGSADVFLGVDSCMLHAADLARVPGVGLFGPTSVTEFGFRFAVHRHVCSDDGTMAGIKEARVLDALEDLLAEPSERRCGKIDMGQAVAGTR